MEVFCKIKCINIIGLFFEVILDLVKVIFFFLNGKRVLILVVLDGCFNNVFFIVLDKKLIIFCWKGFVDYDFI